MTSHQNIKLQIIPPVTLNKQIVSTGYIREKLLNHDVITAAKFLGRPFYLRGILQKDQNQQEYIFQSQRQVPLKGIFQTKLLLKDDTQYSCLTTINKNTEIFIKIESASDHLMSQETQLQFIKKVEDRKNHSI